MDDVKTITLTRRQVDEALAKLAKPLKKYLAIQERAAVVPDPRLDMEFRSLFCGFYRVRRGESWRNAYFGLMTDMRGAPANFGTCLTALQTLTGRVEASFASKLVATIDPLSPVIDSVVLGNLSLRLPRFGDPDRIEKICGVHRVLTASVAAFVGSAAGREAIAAFRAAYPGANVTDAKVVDLVIWQTRPASESHP